MAGCLLITPSRLSAQHQETIHLWPDRVPASNQEKADAQLLPDRGDNVLRLTQITDPSLIVFEADSNLHNGCGVVVCPGGGYRHLSADKEGFEVARWLAGMGYTAFVLLYRVPDHPDAALMDIQRALRIIRSLSVRWDIDRHRLGVIGFSAGAHLGARAAITPFERTYPVRDEADYLSCRPDFVMMIYPGQLDNKTRGSVAAMIMKEKQYPPMFIFGTADDPHGASSLVMGQALREAGIPLELHIMPAGGHGYGMRPGNPAAELWPGLAADWLTRYTNK